MKIGNIYVNGWASAENPHAAGVYVGAGKLLYPDGTHGDIRRDGLLDTGKRWNFEDLASAAKAAVREHHEIANRYVQEVLWPLEFDPETKARAKIGKYTPPGFEEWVKALDEARGAA